MTPVRVSFSCVHGVFDLVVRMCADRDCECETVWLDLKEVCSSTDRREPLACMAGVDTRTWTEVDVPERPKEVSAMVAELLRDYPESERALLRYRTVAWTTATRRLRTYRIADDDVRKGKLVYYGQIVSEAGGYPAEDLTFSLRFWWEGILFRVVDSYCVNPECDCRDVHLQFVEQSGKTTSDGRPIIEERFSAMACFSGQVTVESRHDCSEARAKAICRAWQEQCDDVLKEYEWRYAKIKQIARRSSGKPAILPELPRELPMTSLEKPGRNDPCPCGSGLKYKKCCGR